MLQGGDFTRGDGTGMSLYCKAETAADNVAHHSVVLRTSVQRECYLLPTMAMVMLAAVDTLQVASPSMVTALPTRTLNSRYGAL